MLKFIYENTRELGELKIPIASVRDKVLNNVADTDKDIMQYLIDRKVFPTIVSNHTMRNNPDYDIEDKFIQLISSDSNSRTYNVPYPGSGLLGEGAIYAQTITIYTDGNIRIGNGLLRDPYKYAASTLRAEFYK